MSVGLLWLEADMSAPVATSFPMGTVVCFSSRGPGKSVNEDSAAAVAPREGAVILVVADGMGGLPAGQHASRRAVEALLGRVEQLATKRDSSLRAAVVEGIEHANETVRELSVGAGTTLVTAIIEDGRVRPLHVGDSEALLVGQRGKIRLRTVAHSPTGYAQHAGLLEEHEAMVHEERHLVSNVVGMEEMRIEVGPKIEMKARDTLLLSSDGLTDNLTEDEIVQVIRRGPLVEAAQTLARRSLERMAGDEEPSKPDDLTFLLFRRARS